MAGATAADAASGFLAGAGGASMDHRAAALIHHQPGPALAGLPDATPPARSSSETSPARATP
jgi:hypothetical protein